jgi:3,4-dihydroxy 2-butanone 4-phosphate synthase/GTP cyclohydrolase II
VSAPRVRLDPVEDAVADIAAGRAVVVVDDEDRENEGDLVFAASKSTPELMAFMIRYSSGVVCAPVTSATLDRLGIPLMTPHNRERLRTAYTVSVDARDGVSTGAPSRSAAGSPKSCARCSEPSMVIR